MSKLNDIALVLSWRFKDHVNLQYARSKFLAPEWASKVTNLMKHTCPNDILLAPKRKSYFLYYLTSREMLKFTVKAIYVSSSTSV